MTCWQREACTGKLQDFIRGSILSPNGVYGNGGRVESVPKIGKKIGRGLLHGRQSGGERSSTGQGVLVSSACEKRVRVCES
eukprot:scaffold291359_cov31-Tisochrysis_lutea.AAC.1